MSALDALADKAQAASERLAGPPTDQKPDEAPPAPSGPALGSRPSPQKRTGVNPFVVAGAALVAGVLLAKWIDRRGHANPRW
jgi:hypothetical protein